MSESSENRTTQRKIPDGSNRRTAQIGIDIGRYHFIDAEGWHHEWITKTPREWWQKYQWEKEGGWSQDESQDSN